MRLLPLPNAVFPTELVTGVPADKTAFISFDANRYSVHHDLRDLLKYVGTCSYPCSVAAQRQAKQGIKQVDLRRTTRTRMV